MRRSAARSSQKIILLNLYLTIGANVLSQFSEAFNEMSGYQVFLNMKAPGAFKELKRHFRQGSKFRNFGCATHCNISFMFSCIISRFSPVLLFNSTGLTEKEQLIRNEDEAD